MIENIKLSTFPKEAGIYWFVSNDEVIYAGSSKNLYRRMSQHRCCIKVGCNNECKKDLYQFLAENHFTVHYQLTENYEEEENKLIQQYKPHFNNNRVLPINAPSNTTEYHRQYLQVNKDYNEEHKQYCREWNKEHREYFQEYTKKYFAQICIYEGEEMTLSGLAQRFKKQGIERPVTEAKKYLKEVE